MDDIDPLAPRLTPTARRPLLGMTVLVVEDSRFASEAMRLMCLRSGARIRRADCLRSARRHLQVYRPSAVVIDLGLPDGSGLELIEELHRAVPRVSSILAISGEDHLRPRAHAAGADAFLCKPVETVGAFQRAVLSGLPREAQFNGPAVLSDEDVVPDPLAYRDDMTHVASLLEDTPEPETLSYVAQFLCSVARVAGDNVLLHAAADLMDPRHEGAVRRSSLERVTGLVQERMQEKIAI